MEESLMVHFDEVLTRSLSEVEPEIRCMLAAIKGAGAHPEPMDEADLTNSRCATEFILLMQHRNSTRVREIYSALERLRRGSFGTCTECGGAIGIERLKARPTASVCFECQRGLEALSRKRIA